MSTIKTMLSSKLNILSHISVSQYYLLYIYKSHIFYFSSAILIALNDSLELTVVMYVTVVQSTAPRYTGEFNQPIMLGLGNWVWLGMGTHIEVTSINDREEPLLTFTTFIEHHHQHHIITTPLHLQIDTSCLHRFTPLCGIIKSRS